MATTVVMTKVTKESAPSTRVLVQFADGSGFEFASLAELTAAIREVDTNEDTTRRMCLAYAQARSSDLSNVQSVLNKNFTFDLSDPNPIRVQ